MKPGDLFLFKKDTRSGDDNVWNRIYGGRVIMFLRRVNLDASYTTSEFLIDGRTEFFTDEVMKRWAAPLQDAE